MVPPQQGEGRKKSRMKAVEEGKKKEKKPHEAQFEFCLTSLPD